MARDNEFNGDMGARSIDTMQQMQMSTMTEAMRSFKDSISFQFQNLNLALTQLNSNISNLTTKVGIAGMNNFQQSMPANYLVASTPNPTYLGATPAAYASLSANSSYSSMMLPSVVPASIGAGNFAYHSLKEQPYKRANMLLTNVGAVASGVSSLAFGSLGGTLGGAGIGFLAGGPIGAVVGGVAGSMFGSSIANKIINPIVEDALVHNKDVFAIQRMSRRFGPEFTLSQAQRATRGIEDLAYNERMNSTSLDPMLSMSGYRELTQMGLQAQLLRGNNEKDLVDAVRNAARVTKLFASIMGDKDVQDTLNTVKQLKDMGVNVFEKGDFAKGLMKNNFGYANVLGMSQQQLMSQAATMSMGTFGAQGNPAFMGINSAMRNIALVSELEKRQMLTPGEIASAGGSRALAQQVLNHQASVLNSTSGSLAMYAGGSANGKFDMAKYSKAAEGGYFGVASAAIENYLNDPMAYEANKDRIMEDMASSNPDNVEKIYERILKQELMMNPFFDSDQSTDQKVNTAIVYLRSRLGSEINTQAARIIAYKLFKPSVANGVEARKKREDRLRLAAQENMKQGLGYAIASVKSVLPRAGALFYQKAIRPIGNGAIDRLSNYFSNYDVSTMIPKEGTYTNALEAYRAGNAMYEAASKDPKFDKYYQQYNAEDWDKTINQIDNPGVMNTLANFFSSSTRFSRGAIASNKLVTDKDIYDLMGADKQGNRKVDSFEAELDIQNKGLLKSSMKTITDKVENYRPLTGELTLDMVKRAAADTMAADLKESFDEKASDKLKKLSKSMTSEDINTIKGLMSRTITGNGANLSNNAIVSAIRNGNDAESRLKDIAKRMGTDVNSVLNTYLYNTYGYSKLGNVEKAQLIGGSSYDRLVAAAANETNLDLKDVDTDFITIKNSNITRGLEQLGLSQDVINSVMNSSEGKTYAADVKGLMELANKVAKGEDVTAKDISSSIKGKTLQRVAQSLNKSDSNITKQALNNILNRKKGGLGVFFDAITGYNPLSDDELATATRNASLGVGALTSESAREQIRIGLETQGLKLSGTDLDTLLKGKEGYGDIVRRELSKLKESGNEEALENFERAKKYLMNSGKGLTGDILNKEALLTLSVTEGKKITEENNKNKDKINSKTDTTVVQYKGEPALRVVTAKEMDAETKLHNAQEARKQVDNSTSTFWEKLFSPTTTSVTVTKNKQDTK